MKQRKNDKLKIQNDTHLIEANWSKRRFDDVSNGLARDHCTREGWRNGFRFRNTHFRAQAEISEARRAAGGAKPFWVRTSWPDWRSPKISGVWETIAIAEEKEDENEAAEHSTTLGLDRYRRGEREIEGEERGESREYEEQHSVIEAKTSRCVFKSR